ncbi:hypothetical protein [Anaerolinea thermophila]|uniref:Hypothetical membrane protein n=2 Tax=Anaerolinea TaxID=233189 RepID=E8N2C5_ANATU|nr:hypothetical protein [Anaerolinea thermophila]BAJ62731.1 hypothetical membrane protein [Anaerolinea thermophila UNI-1]
MRRFFLSLYAALLAFFFAQVFSAQVLGLTGIYRAITAIPLTLLLTILAILVYWRWSGNAFLAQLPEEIAFPAWANRTLAIVGMLLVLAIAVLPTALWPLSPVSETLHWDAGAYHFPKAVELYKSGNVWDLSIPYGEFPFGYESMLSFALLVAGKETFFGLVHALTALTVFLGLWLMARRATTLPDGVLMFLLGLIFVSEAVTVKANPFYIFLDQSHMIGKNDLFLAMGVIAAFAHAPLGRAPQNSRVHLPGLVYATLLVLATKPAGMFAVTPLWLPVLWDWFKGWKNTPRWRELGFATFFIVPGGLWAVRNLFIIHTIFPEGVWEMNEWSIANNLTNPYFYNYLPRNFVFLLLVLGISLLLTLLRRKPYWRISVAFLILFVGFIFTPESGFMKTTQVPTQTAWRLGIALVAYEVVVLLALFEPLINAVLKRLPAWIIAAPAVLIALGLMIYTRDLYRLNPQNAIVLRDEFREPVGVDGYHSAYDFVQKNLRNAVIQIEGGVFYYMYGPGYTNSPTKLHYPLGREHMVPQLDPQYLVVIPHGDPFEPSADFMKKWKIIYRDPEGIVLERIAP